MGKQNLEKCLSDKPQSEHKMWTSYPKLSQHSNLIAVNLEKDIGKMIHPKSSQQSR